VSSDLTFSVTKHFEDKLVWHENAWTPRWKYEDFVAACWTSTFVSYWINEQDGCIGSKNLIIDASARRVAVLFKPIHSSVRVVSSTNVYVNHISLKPPYELTVLASRFNKARKTFSLVRDWKNCFNVGNQTRESGLAFAVEFGLS
jgi:hypothetical protein